MVCCVIQNEKTALILASENGHAACVSLLVESGVDKEAADNVCYIRFSFLASLFLFRSSMLMIVTFCCAFFKLPLIVTTGIAL
jgi:hypothetical protein